MTTLTSSSALDLERQVCFAMVLASRGIVQAYRPVLEPMGLTHPQHLVMLALWQHAPLSLSRIAHLLQLDPGTVSPLLKRLEAAGLVERTRTPGDERTLSVTLTDTGLALRSQAEQVPEQMTARLGLSQQDLEQLHTLMTRVVAAAERANRLEG
ncbi:MarR family winged helix-turn-helix transcriptional regulator [Kineococcus sp. SYSU DK018]|uniref:MarR family winged helix-turn-helix transcriptional regulator n=1 Tax=Kineococcus sp. SYSU DK018 TaxID=3383139 RepID=UPI003D7EE464